MATRRKAATPTQDITPFILLAGVLGMVAGVWFGLPGVVALWASMVGASWMSVAVDPDNEKSVRRHRYAKSLQTGLLLPIRSIMKINQASWVTSVLIGIFAYLLPDAGSKQMTAASGHMLNALAAAFMSFAISIARTDVIGSDYPGLPLTKIRGAVKSIPMFFIGGLAGLGLGALGAYELGLHGPKLGYSIAVRTIKPPTQFTHGVYQYVHSGILLANPLLFTVVTAVLVGWIVFTKMWGQQTLGNWRELSESRKVWANYWMSLKKDPAPVLVSRVTVEDLVTIETFQILPHENVNDYLALEVKYGPMTQAWKVAALSLPERDDQPGTWAATRFAIVQWAAAADVTSASAEITSWWLRSSMAWTVHTANVYPEPALGRLALISEGNDIAEDLGMPVASAKGWWQRFKENSPTESTLDAQLKKDEKASEPPSSEPGDQLWVSAWNFPANCASWYMREEMLDTLIATVGCEAAIDHRSDTAYFGVLEGESVSPKHATIIEALATQDRWRNIWKNALKSGANAPRAQSPLALTAEIANGAEVNRMPFTVSEGKNPLEYRDVEGNLKTALGGAKFVAVTGWPDAGSDVGRPGDRHPQALCVYWSMDYVPMSPSKLEPSVSPANQWVLAGIVNDVFRTLKMTTPEVTAVRPLTKKKSPEHTWEISLRLYGDVTTAMVRKNGLRIGEMLAIPWVRVTDADDGCVLYLGATPTDEILNKEKDRALVASLDWEQAFLLTSVVGSSGAVPTLVSTDHLPSNQSVQVLDFALPPGLNQSLVKQSIQKLRTATGNSYIEVLASPQGPTHITIQASVNNPLSFPIPVDFRAIDDARGLPFGTGVSGEPVEFFPHTDVHVAIIGMTGSGKSVASQVILYGAVVKGYEVYVIDPIKGAADFKFLEPYTKATATTINDAANLLRFIYAEVERRKALNSKYGTASIYDLPEDVRPAPIFVMIDEFTSLIINSEKIDRQPNDDPELEAERQQQIATKNDRAVVGTMTGKLAREARSAGVSLGLGTQKLMAATLESIPGGGDLKGNMSRLLIGKTSTGERMSALRAFDQAPDPGDEVPPGRAIWESAVRTGVLIQGWWSPLTEFSEELSNRVQPLADDEKIDLTSLRKSNKTAPAAFSAIETTGDEPVEPEQNEVTDIGEFTFSLDDVVDDDQAETPSESDEPEVAVDDEQDDTDSTEQVEPIEVIESTSAPEESTSALDDNWDVFGTPDDTLSPVESVVEADSGDDEFSGWSRVRTSDAWEE